jgi:hypothetical protein
MNNIHVNQQVICIYDKVPIESGVMVKDAQITEGEIYTIRWVGPTSHYVFGDYIGVRIEGIVAQFGMAYGDPDCPYNAKRFRPLVTDPIALFRSYLVDPNAPIKETNEPRKPVRVKEDVE